MRLLSVCLLAVLLPVSASMAQEFPPGDDSPAAGIFPLALLLEEAEFAGDSRGAWQPDWPPQLPPDSFKILSGEARRITLASEDFSLVFSRGPGGLAEEFPVMRDGRMSGLVIVREGTKIREMEITFPDGEGNRKLELLEYDDSFPSLVRFSRGGNWYFIFLVRGGNEIRETWYDRDGVFLGAYGYSLMEIGEKRRIHLVRDLADPAGAILTERHYDSRGFLTESLGSEGVYKVLYFREDLPRYWERLPGIAGYDRTEADAGKFTLQWDEAGFLVRMTSGNPDTGEGFSDSRYEYTLDGNGNWIERREIRMVRRSGLLTPAQGTVFSRVLEYGKPE